MRLPRSLPLWSWALLSVAGMQINAAPLQGSSGVSERGTRAKLQLEQINMSQECPFVHRNAPWNGLSVLHVAGLAGDNEGSQARGACAHGKRRRGTGTAPARPHRALWVGSEDDFSVF